MTGTPEAAIDWSSLIVFWIFGAIVFAIIGALIGNSKGLRTEGALLGLLLGIIGVLIIAVMKPARGFEAQRGGPPGAGQIVGWHPDPTNRHQSRFFNGAAWTADVADNGVSAKDELPQDVANFVAPPLVPQPVRPMTSAGPPVGTGPRKWDATNRQWLRKDSQGNWLPENS